MNSLLWVACGFFALALGLGIMSSIVFHMHQQLIDRPVTIVEFWALVIRYHRSKRVR